MSYHIVKTTVNKNDLVHAFLPVNFTEVYEAIIDSKTPPPSADEIQLLFWSDTPSWIKGLLKIRGKIVSHFGVKSTEGSGFTAFEECIKGKNSDELNVPVKSDNETVMCAKDTHLTMYFATKAVQINDSQILIAITTLVKFHNWFGYVYFYGIAPFHVLIVKSKFKSIAKKLSQR